MNADELKAALSDAAPPDGLSPALLGLWHAGKGGLTLGPDWDRAHEVAQGDDGADAAWTHALLHRIEGDAANAAYWYRRANRPVATGGFQEEWTEIAKALTAR